MSAPSTDPESLQRCIGTGRRRGAHCSRPFDRAVGCGRFSLQVIVMAMFSVKALARRSK
jgi:hypothetical protein